MADANYTLKTLDGSEIPLFMSFGLLNLLVKTVKDPDLVPQLPFLHDLRDEVLEELIQMRGKNGKLIGDRNKLEDMCFDPSVVVELLSWAEDHILSFFISQAKSLHKLNVKNAKILEALTPSTPG